MILLGSSGSGKTTLLNCLSNRNMKGFKRKGEIRINGEYLDGGNMRKMISYMQQEDVFIPSLTVREQLVFHGKLCLNSTWSQMNQKIEELLSDVC